MPLITKANRRVKKPAWQRGTTTANREQRDAQAIVANHEQKFTRSFLALLRNLITPDMLKQVTRAIREESTVDSIMKRIPFFDESNPDTFAIWDNFARKLESTYQAIIDEAADNESRKRGWKIELQKVERPDIPVNPSVAEFIRFKSLSRAVDLSESEAARIREILTTGLEEFKHSTAMVAEIEATVGLTEKQLKRLNKKLVKARAEGAAAKAIDKLRLSEAGSIRKQRARAIARTETNEALSVGLQESWRAASEQGLMPPGARKRWSAVPEEPGRSSEVCQDLDGQEVGMNENFSSTAGEGFNGPGPPAHPNCRSTLVLVFPE